MKVSELISVLSELDPDLRVMTPGFDECGYDLISRPKIKSVSWRRTALHGGDYDHDPSGENVVMINW